MPLLATWYPFHRVLTTGVRAILAILILLCAATSARLAAQSYDVHISTLDTPYYYLFGDARMQSAARIGTRTLVAWGSTVLEPRMCEPEKFSYRNELYFATFDGVDHVGMPQPMHEPDAQPYDIVTVVNLHDRFLVLWNDRRDGAAGIYARTVDTTGAMLGDTYRLAPGTLASEDAVWITPLSDESYLLVWGDSTGGTTSYYRAQLHRNAHRVGAIDEIVQANFDDDLTFNELPGAHILRDKAGGRFVHASGDTDARTIPARFLNQPHHLAADTSIVVAESDTGLVRWITFYRSVFDTIVERRIRITLPDGPVATCALARDSIGRTIIVVNRHIVSPDPIVSMSAGYLIRYVLRDDGTLTDSETVARTYEWITTVSASFGSYGNLDSYGVTFGDRNTTRLTYTFTRVQWQKFPTGGSSSSQMTSTLTLDDVAHPYALDPAVETSTSRSTRERINVSRRSVGDSSAVRVEFDSMSARDVAVAIPPTPRHFSHMTPALAYVDDTLLVAWQSSEGDHRFGLARMMSATESGIVPVPGIAFINLSGPEQSGQNCCILGRWNDFFAISNASTNTYVSPDHQHGYTIFDYTLATPSGSGFTSTPLATSAWATLKAHGYDPDSGRVTGMLEGYRFDGTCFTTDRRGQPVRTEVLGIQSPSAILPFSNGRCILIRNDSALCFAQSHLIAIRALRPAPTASAEHFQRLRCDRFLRIYPEHGADSNGIMPDHTVVLESYDANALRLFTATLTAPSNRYDLFVYERAFDSALFVVWGSEDGVHLTVLDARLRVQMADKIVSTTRSRAYAPVCSVHGAVFIAAWEDYRNGKADIYGTMRDVDQLWNGTIHVDHRSDSATAQQRIADNEAIVVRRVFPVPADAWLCVEFTTGRDEEVTIDVVDMAGRRVEGTGPLAAARGSSSAAIPTHALHPGAYTVVLRTASGASARARAVVVH